MDKPKYENIAEVANHSLSALIKYIEKEEYKGYDPYDTFSSPLLLKIPGNLSKYLLLQFQKRNPINIRPLLGIKKDYVHKGIALFLNSYSRLALFVKESDKDSNKEIYQNYLSKCSFLYDWLLTNTTDGYEGLCWSLHVPIAKANRLRPKNDPSSVLAAFVGDSFFEYYNLTQDKEIVLNMEKIGQFLLKYIPVTENKHGICFSYTTKLTDIVFNANMHVARFFAQLYKLTNNEKYLILSKRSVDFSIAYQKEDGRWVYSVTDSGKERHQYDFHQGFMIDCLLDYINLTNCKDEKVQNALVKATSFYKDKLFDSKGVSYWRYPKRWPIDIHNQAQGVVSFAKMCEINKDNIEFSKKIALWTISNMQHQEGYFYHQKWPLFTNKIPYIRWGQAWMMYALTILKEKTSVFE